MRAAMPYRREMGKWPTDSLRPQLTFCAASWKWETGTTGTAMQWLASSEPTTRLTRFPNGPDRPSNTGRDGFGKLLDEWTQNFHDFHWELEEVFDAGEKAVGVGRLAGRSMHLGVPIEGELAGVFEIWRVRTTLGVAAPSRESEHYAAAVLLLAQVGGERAELRR
jgi:hypothetical protein